jgi:RNAse (barnase) inhibitor barstar
MIGDVSEFSWPDSDAGYAARVRAAWSATCQALPVGTAITGEVIGRQRFGVFLRIDAHPDAIGLVEITSMPRGLVLPAIGERVTGEVIDHAHHNFQVKAKLTEWASSTGPDVTSAESLYRELAANTFVSLWWTRELFDQTVGRLRDQRFAVVEVDASAWTTAAAMHQDIATALNFPDYYGRNLDALNDCLRHVVSGEYGIPADAAGFVLAFTHYDRFKRECPREAQIVLDILADHGRRAAVFGQRVLCLVHTDDPGVAFEPVGATHIEWNQAEWLNARRQPGA